MSENEGMNPDKTPHPVDGGNEQKQNEPQAEINQNETQLEQLLTEHAKEQQEPQEEPPLVVDLSGISEERQEKVVDLSRFQHIASGFFAQTKEPALSINGKTVTVNAAAVRLFPNAEFMEILIDSEDKKVAFLPCGELNIRGYKWAREKNGKRYPTQRTGLPFVLTVCQIMKWNPDRRYRILGKKVPSSAGEEVLLFDLTANQGFEKPDPGDKSKKSRSTILTGWDGRFGPAYNESESTLHIDTFDGFTFFSIKDGWIKNDKNQSDNDQGEHQKNEDGDEE